MVLVAREQLIMCDLPADEDVHARHKRERKQLQSEIQALKKTCPKGDKKRKKEILDEIVRLELELDERHAREMEQEQLGESDCVADVREDEVKDAGVRVSKAQRRRNKKSAEEKEREERIAEQEVKNRSGPRVKELEEISARLAQSGLQLHQIAADGNCLYCAVDHQLGLLGRGARGVPELRRLTAQQLREHRDDYLPFMAGEDGRDFTQAMFEEYCVALERRAVWGGQVELRALSCALGCPIRVVQAGDTGAPLHGDHLPGPPLVIAYHRHLYRLGEHYNSTQPLVQDNTEPNP